MKWGVALGNAAGSGMNAYLAISQAMRQQEEYDRKKAAEDAYTNYDPTAIPEGFDPNVPFKQEATRAPVYQNPTAPQTANSVAVGAGEVANQAYTTSGGISRAAQTSRIALQQGPQQEPILQNMVDVSAITNPTQKTAIPAAPAVAPKPAVDNGMYVKERGYRDNVAAAKANSGAEVLTFGTEKSPSALLRQKADLWEQGAVGNPAREKLVADAEKMRVQADRMEVKEQKEMAKALNIAAQRNNPDVFFQILSNHVNNGETYKVDSVDKATGDVTVTVSSSVDPSAQPYKMTLTPDQMTSMGKAATLDPVEFNREAFNEKQFAEQRRQFGQKLELDYAQLDEQMRANRINSAIALKRSDEAYQRAQADAYRDQAEARAKSNKPPSVSDQTAILSMAGGDPILASTMIKLAQNNPGAAGNLPELLNDAKLVSDPKAQDRVTPHITMTNGVLSLQPGLAGANNAIKPLGQVMDFQGYLNITAQTQDGKGNPKIDPKRVNMEVGKVEQQLRTAIKRGDPVFPVNPAAVAEKMKANPKFDRLAAEREVRVEVYNSMFDGMPGLVDKHFAALKADPDAKKYTPEQLRDSAKVLAGMDIDKVLFGPQAQGFTGYGRSLIDYHNDVVKPDAAKWRRKADIDEQFGATPQDKAKKGIVGQHQWATGQRSTMDKELIAKHIGLIGGGQMTKDEFYNQHGVTYDEAIKSFGVKRPTRK